MTNPRQMRRQARKLRRHGIQPIVFLGGPNDGPPAGDLVLLRLLWRYRSELAPVGVAAAPSSSAGGCIRPRARWEIVARRCRDRRLDGGDLRRPNGTRGLARAGLRGRRCPGRRRLAQRGNRGSARGPRRCRRLLLFGGSLLAVPWWTHRRRRARVRVERKLDAWPDIARAVGLAGSQVMSAAVDVWGWRARIRLARGQTISDVIAKIPALESALGTFRGAIRVYPDHRRPRPPV